MSASSLTLPQGKSATPKQFISRHINEIGLLVVIAILYLVFSFNAPGFISLNNQMNVLRDAATIGIAAWAMTLIIISGEIDVSVRSDGGVYLRLPRLSAAVSGSA